MKHYKRRMLKILVIVFAIANIMSLNTGVMTASAPEGVNLQGIQASAPDMQAKALADSGASAEGIAAGQNDRSNEIIVKYRDEKKAEAVRNGVKSKLKLSKINIGKKLKKHRAEVLKANDVSDMNRIIKELKKDPNVEFVQPNYKLEVNSLPADPELEKQWALENFGQAIQGYQGREYVDINAASAWDITMGTPDTIIGVLDTGIDLNHTDLKDSIYVNTKEIPGNGIDDDGNGYIDDINGWDFANDDNSIYDSAEEDAHGTAIAGIIAAKSDDQGIVGVAPNVKLLPLKFISGEMGYTCDLIEAIDYASKMGVKIINCSFGGVDDNYALKDAMTNSGMLFVCPAGNRGEDLSQKPIYPACFDLPNVLSVAAIDNLGVMAPFSGYGSKVAVAAPGINVLSTAPGNEFNYISGTSVSAAYVTGVAALIKSNDPEAGITQIADKIRNGITSCSNLQGKTMSGGRIDAYAALTGNRQEADEYDGAGTTYKGIYPGEQGSGSDSWYTMNQLAKITEELHYGESGINPASGNLSFTCNDMSMDTPGFELNMSRTYNSKNSDVAWRFGFEAKLTIDGNIMTVQLPNGSVNTFTYNNGVYTPNDSRSRLEMTGSNNYVLTTADQYSYGFALETLGSYEIVLKWMKDRNGNTITINNSYQAYHYTTHNKRRDEDVDHTVMVKARTEITDSVGRKYTAYYGNDFQGRSFNSIWLYKIVEEGSGRTVKYGYDGTTHTRLLYATDATDKNTMYYTYNSQGLLERIEDTNRKLVEAFNYDGLNRVYRFTDSLGNTYTYGYATNSNGAVTSTTVTDKNNRQWKYTFDANQSKISEQDPEGRTTYTEYSNSKLGEVSKVTDRNGNITEYKRDGSGNIIKTINPDISYSECSYDAKNNLIMEKDETGRCTYYFYDDDKINLIKTVQPLNGTDVYRLGYSEAQFAITSYSYYTAEEAAALFGCSVKGLKKSDTDPMGNTTRYTYDKYGNVKTESDPDGKTVAYEYNITGWKTAEISPMGNRTEYSYNNNGQLEKAIMKNPGNETRRTVYDSLGQKIQEIAPNQYDVSQEDAASGLYKADTGYRYKYYDSGKLMSVTDPENNITGYTYDIYGNILTETKPNSSIYRYEYDIMDRPIKKYFKADGTSAEILLEEYFYTILADKRTQKTVTEYLNDSEKAITAYIYDYAGRLVEQQNPDGTKVITIYNPNGTIASVTGANKATTYYKYNGLNLQSETWSPLEISNGKILFAYTKQEYDKAGRKLIEKSGKEKVEKDALPSSFITKSYEYYKNDKLKSETDNEGRQTNYYYDADGNLSKEEVYTSANEKQVTEYENNYFGKPVKEKLHIRTGDIYGNSYDNQQDMLLTTMYTYDKNGNIKTETAPDGVTTSHAYDNMDRETSTSEPGIDEYGKASDITTKKTYTWDGKVLTETDANNNTTRYQYDRRGFLIKTIDPLGGITACEYDRSGRKTKEVSPKNYDAAKQISQMSRAEFVYDVMDRVKLERDVYTDPNTGQWEEANTKAYLYDADGNVIKELDALGYDAGTGSSIDERIRTGYGKECTYNLDGDLLTVLDCETKARNLPYTNKYEYDALGRKVSESDARGVITKYTYDSADNLLTTTVQKNSNAKAKNIKICTYDLADRLTSETDANGNTVRHQYNAFGSESKCIYPGDDTIPANTVISQYDVTGQLVRTVDSMGREDLYSYDNQGRQLSHTQQRQGGSEAITTRTSYDKNGNKRFETDGNNVKKENVYDALDRVISSTVKVKGINKTTQYTYDANDNQLTATDWLGNTSSNKYDPLNRLVEKRDPYAVIQRLEYNKNSSQIKAYDAANNLTEYRYDKNNRLLETVDGEKHSTSQAYDEAGNIKSKTDGKGNKTQYEYDEHNRLTSVRNAKLETTSYIYDGNGNLLSQTDGNGNITTFEYNVANKQIKRIDNGGRSGQEGAYSYNSAKVESYSYSADGSIAAMTDKNGKTTIYSYDIHGRLTGETVGTIEITYTYDGNGNQLTMTDSTGITTRTYDEENRTTSKTVPGIGTMSYGYDIQKGSGCVAETSRDHKGNTVEKVYDRSGRLISVTAGGGTTAYEYYPNGNRKKITYPNGTVEEYEYYMDNRLHMLTNKKADGTVIEKYTYIYDASGNQTGKTDNKGVTGYDYDELNRLSGVTEPDGKRTVYTYDAGGNRKTQTVIAASKVSKTIYSYNNQNRLVGTVEQKDTGEEQRESYAYDNNGNLLVKSTLASSKGTGQEALKPDSIGVSVIGKAGSEAVVYYRYDGLNQLVGVISGENTTRYAYNGEGKRVEKEIKGQKTRYVYEGDVVAFETNSSGEITAKNVQGLNTITRTVDGQTVYYMYNGHADVTALLDGSGKIVATYYYDAFGNITEQTGSINNNITYAGYQYDSETGLYYLNARMYDPKTARFLQEDSYRGDAQDPLSLNLYTYCHNEPLMYTDPTGHKWMDQGGKDKPRKEQKEKKETKKEPKKQEKKSIVEKVKEKAKQVKEKVKEVVTGKKKESPAQKKQESVKQSKTESKQGNSKQGNAKQESSKKSEPKVSKTDVKQGGGTNQKKSSDKLDTKGKDSSKGTGKSSIFDGVDFGESIKTGAQSSAKAWGDFFNIGPNGWSGDALQEKKAVVTDLAAVAVFHKVGGKISQSSGQGAQVVNEENAVINESQELRGQFSIAKWDNYPKGAPKPQGPFEILEGESYSSARQAANNANRALHAADPSLKGQQIHEIHPVKLGGSPTDISNKVPLSPEQHREFTVWWNKLLRELKGK